ncbi:hypothetical protein wTpre_125 [Wolbachia endosymbiont of Trichogramma pretiosum]|nr:hypothetical protein wTpre_125 [Wolbachia endosymbiont of Trichogramma pretiosum]
MKNSTAVQILKLADGVMQTGSFMIRHQIESKTGRSFSVIFFKNLIL